MVEERLSLMYSVLMDIVGLLNYLGITKEAVVPQIFVLVVFYFWLIRPKANKFQDDASTIKGAVIELQTFLSNKHKMSFNQLINMVGQSNSPIVLRDSFKPLINKSNLDKQVKKKTPKLLKWLRLKMPENGLDAQDQILNLTTTTEIDKYLDLNEFRQNAYLDGKTRAEADVILAVYLFGKLIPELFPDN